MIWEALRQMPPELQTAIAATCLFNFALWLFVILALKQLRTAIHTVLLKEQLIFEKEQQIMADQTITKVQFLAAIQAAVADLKTNLQAGLDKEKGEILAILQPIITAGGNFSAADLQGVVDLIKGVGTTSVASIDTLSDSVAAALQTTGGTGGGGTPAP
jgi:pseudouridine-5'-phosphate glycosidase